eukprot:6388854-Prymnesium_polylepis.1
MRCATSDFLLLLALTGSTSCGATELRPRPQLDGAVQRLRGGMSFQQGVLAWTGSVVTLSGVATVLDPAWTRAKVRRKRSSSESTQDGLITRLLAVTMQRGDKEVVSSTEEERMVTDLLGLAMLGWGVGKLCVRRGYERAFMKLNFLP